MSTPALYGRLNGSTRWLARELPAVARLCGTTLDELIGDLIDGQAAK